MSHDPEAAVGLSSRWARMPVIISSGYTVAEFVSALMCDAIAGWKNPDVLQMVYHIFVFRMPAAGYTSDLGRRLADSFLNICHTQTGRAISSW